MRQLSAELGLVQHKPTRLHMDNSAVVSLSRDFASSSRTRHIPRRQFQVRELQHKGEITTVKVATQDNWSDVFTKILTRVPFEKFIRPLMNLVRLGATVVRPKGPENSRS